MPDYKALYFKLLRAHSQAIQILTQAAREAEEMVLDSKEPIEFLTFLLAEEDTQIISNE